MELKFQYNKINLQKFQYDVKVRMRALPILRAKEAALRLEVKERKKTVEAMELKLEALKKPILENIRLWSEFPDLLEIKNIETEKLSIAGVHVLKFEKAMFHVHWFSVFDQPKWFLEGIALLQNMLSHQVHLHIEKENLRRLSLAGKKTTQKVNLYEKIQIPAFNRAILQIKRFLEDEDNLSRAGQKIMKKRRSA